MHTSKILTTDYYSNSDKTDKMAITAQDLQHKPLTQILAPKKMDEVIVLPRIKKLLEKGLYGNILFYGPPGVGKSTMSRLLSDNMIVKYINASLNGNIETLRNELTTFASETAIAIESINQKVLWLDEFDGASASFYDAIRGFTEQYPKIFFIATANKFYKLQKYDYIESRFECVNCAPENQEEKDWLMSRYKSRFKSISKGVGLTFENEDVVNYVCEAKFPDFRGIYKFIQNKFKVQERGQAITMHDVVNAVYEFNDLYSMILGDTPPEKFHEYLVINFADKVDDVIMSLDQNFVKYLMEKASHLNMAIPEIIMENAKHQHWFITAMDQTTVMKSLCFTLNQIVKKYAK